MAVSDLARAFNEVTGALPSVNLDLGYVLAVTGLVILMLFVVGLGVVLAIRVARAIANMTPERFVVFTAVLAGVLIIAGSLLP